MKPTTLSEFYEDAGLAAGGPAGYQLPEPLAAGIGHFNVFSIAAMAKCYREQKTMPYNRRTYYKISLMIGHNLVAYADKVVEVKEQGLLFATPKVPYHYIPQDEAQDGYFCVFTEEFLQTLPTRLVIDELSVFRSGGNPVLLISPEEREQILPVFRLMEAELASDYVHKYDLIRSYLMQLIHFGQKLMPAPAQYATSGGTARIATLFTELLERQFPIESPRQQLQLRTPKDYAARLAVHVNHLNKSLKDTTGQTTSALIGYRIIREAGILLKQTGWSISEIGWSLGFDEPAHFSNFFRKHTGLSPLAFRASAAAI